MDDSYVNTNCGNCQEEERSQSQVQQKSQKSTKSFREPLEETSSNIITMPAKTLKMKIDMEQQGKSSKKVCEAKGDSNLKILCQ